MENQKIPQIGWWWAECCEEDLFQIKTQEELDEVMEYIRDHNEDNFILRVWPTREEALIDLGPKCGA